MPKQGWTPAEVVRICGIAYRRLDAWDRRGFLKPSVAQGTGKGRWRPRLYSFRDLLALRVARELRDAGVSLQALRKVRDLLLKREAVKEPFAELRLVVTPGRKDKPDVALVRDLGELESVLQAPGQRLLRFVLDLAPIMQELRERSSQEAEQRKPAAVERRRAAANE